MLRTMMSQFNVQHKKRIGGPGLGVEIDECHIHSRKYGVGRVEASEQWWVFGGICRQTKEMFVVIVEDRTRNTLAKAIFENTEHDSFGYSDCWREYTRLEELDLDLVHKTVNHSQNF